jgi:hypothetical protein
MKSIVAISGTPQQIENLSIASPVVTVLTCQLLSRSRTNLFSSAKFPANGCSLPSLHNDSRDNQQSDERNPCKNQKQSICTIHE